MPKSQISVLTCLPTCSWKQNQSSGVNRATLCPVNAL